MSDKPKRELLPGEAEADAWIDSLKADAMTVEDIVELALRSTDFTQFKQRLEDYRRDKARTDAMSDDKEAQALRYATRLLEHFVAEHFPHNPDWKPLPDLIGVLTQLDNAMTIARDYKERLRAGGLMP